MDRSRRMLYVAAAAVAACATILGPSAAAADDVDRAAGAIARLARKEVVHVRRYAALAEKSIELALRKVESTSGAGNLAPQDAFETVVEALHESLCEVANEIDASARTLESRFKDAIEGADPEHPLDAALLAGAAGGAVESFRRGAQEVADRSAERFQRRAARLLRTTDARGKYRSHVVAFAPPVAVPLLTNPPTDPASGTPRATDAVRVIVAAAGGYMRRAKTGRIVIAGVTGPDVPSVHVELKDPVSRLAAKFETDETPKNDSPSTIVTVRRPGDVRRWSAAFPKDASGDRDDTTGFLQGRNVVGHVDAAGRGTTNVEIGIPAADVTVPDFEDPGDAVVLAVGAAPIAPTKEQVNPDGRIRRTHVFSASVTPPGTFEVATLSPEMPEEGSRPLDTSVEVFDVTDPMVAKHTIVARGDDDGAAAGGELARVRFTLTGTDAKKLEVRVSSWGGLNRDYRVSLVKVP